MKPVEGPDPAALSLSKGTVSYAAAPRRAPKAPLEGPLAPLIRYQSPASVWMEVMSQSTVGLKSVSQIDCT